MLIGATIVVIALGVVDQGIINAQSVQGALCVYFLLGLLFTFLYGAVATLGDGDFFAQAINGDRSIRVYFSFVTLATVGYGDYTAVNGSGADPGDPRVARRASCISVTVVAVLVSHIGLRHRVGADARRARHPTWTMRPGATAARLAPERLRGSGFAVVVLVAAAFAAGGGGDDV